MLPDHRVLPVIPIGNDQDARLAPGLDLGHLGVVERDRVVDHDAAVGHASQHHLALDLAHLAGHPPQVVGELLDRAMRQDGPLGEHFRHGQPPRLW
ncbi:MAG: hypothetical protein E6J91_17510 [Deltaproteobacteria bacterium]|nr:MAG: hypothetical protein E6J91_17510 [Deltaproteobacteria bacterium]